MLVRKVFPELRRKCRERQVELVDVDLRWGITEEEAQQGKVLPICLAEIDRSRPFFMGFIGERYGWIPEQEKYDLSLIMEQPWLDEHRGGKSVTELEMLHGVLNNPAMEDRAFFYFRDPAWSQKKGGAYLSEGLPEKAKLEALKDRIRQSGYPVVEDYLTPEALAERVKEDLWKLIDEAYPVDDVPDSLALERRKHEAYGELRLGLYLGGKQYFTALDAAMNADPFAPVFITGASGGGKSALIANWSRVYGKKHLETLKIVHYLGSGADAADPVKLVTRLLQEIAQITGDELKLESDPQKILDALPQWLARASSYAEREGKRWLILLDGLDKLSSLRDLLWWPSFLPPLVKLVVSCLDGEVQDEAKNRMEWTTVEVHPFDSEERRQFITEYLGKYRKSLKPEQVARVNGHPLSGNPLFLRTLLEELRIFGVHEEVSKKTTWYLQSQTIDQLFAKVLERVEGDTAAKAVRYSMEAIWASRAGLAQDELLAITGLVPATWAPIHIALDEAIFENAGKINFVHDYLRKAVEHRYGITGNAKFSMHRKIAKWFSKNHVNARIAEELPWQWKEAGEWEKLRECLLAEQIFTLGYDSDRYQMLAYWLAIPNRKTLSEEYEQFSNLPSAELEDSERGLAVRLGEFLHLSGERTVLARSLLFAAFAKTEALRGIADPETHRIGEQYWESLYESDLINEAEAFHASLMERTLSVTGDFHPGVATILSSTGLIRKNQGHLIESLILYEKALTIRTKLYGELHPATLKTVSAIASVKSDEGKLNEAEDIYRKVLRARIEKLGANHEKTLLTASSLALVLKRAKRFEESEKLCRDVLNRRNDVFGRTHPETLKSISLLAGLLKDLGKLDEALKLYDEVTESRLRALGLDHPRTLQAMHGLGTVHNAVGNYSKAALILKKALDGRVRRLGQDHPDTVNTSLALAEAHLSNRETQEALWHLRSAHESLVRAYGRDHKKSKNVALKITKILEK